MPFRHAHWFLLALLASALWAFWPGYLSKLPESSEAFHLHGLTGFLWMVLLIAQSFAIQSGRYALHRTIGLSIFALFPVFTAGGVLVVHTMAQKTAAGDLFYQTFGARLGAVDFYSSVALVGLVWAALRERRNVRLHAGYMLSTAFFLVMPAVARILTDYPPFLVDGPAAFDKFGQALHVTIAATVLFAGALWLRNRKDTPMLVIAILVALESVFFEIVGRTDAWKAVFFGLGDTSAVIVTAFGWIVAVLGMLAGWGGVPHARAPAAPPKRPKAPSPT